MLTTVLGTFHVYRLTKPVHDLIEPSCALSTRSALWVDNNDSYKYTYMHVHV